MRYTEVDDINSAIRWAMFYISVEFELCEKPAIVLDIDGTILFQNEKLICNTPIRRLVNECLKNKIEIFVITARPESYSNRKLTEEQLSKCGIRTKRLFMMPANSEYGTYKYKCREFIRNQKYDILLSVGDQWADISNNNHHLEDGKYYVGALGDFNEYGIKLPSEFI